MTEWWCACVLCAGCLPVPPRAVFVQTRSHTHQDVCPCTRAVTHIHPPPNLSIQVDTQHVILRPGPTGRSVVLTSGPVRTMRTFLPPDGLLKPEELTPEVFKFESEPSAQQSTSQDGRQAVLSPKMRQASLGLRAAGSSRFEPEGSRDGQR